MKPENLVEPYQLTPRQAQLILARSQGEATLNTTDAIRNAREALSKQSRLDLAAYEKNLSLILIKPVHVSNFEGTLKIHDGHAQLLAIALHPGAGPITVNMKLVDWLWAPPSTYRPKRASAPEIRAYRRNDATHLFLERCQTQGIFQGYDKPEIQRLHERVEERALRALLGHIQGFGHELPDMVPDDPDHARLTIYKPKPLENDFIEALLKSAPARLLQITNAVLKCTAFHQLRKQTQAKLNSLGTLQVAGRTKKNGQLGNPFRRIPASPISAGSLVWLFYANWNGAPGAAAPWLEAWCRGLPISSDHLPTADIDLHEINISAAAPTSYERQQQVVCRDLANIWLMRKWYFFQSSKAAGPMFDPQQWAEDTQKIILS